MMREHIAAIEALLNAAQITTYYVEVPANVTPTFPYVLLWGSSGTPGPEQSVLGADDLTDLLGVTCVAATGYGVLTVRSMVRAVLDGSRPVLTGRLVWLSLVDSQRTQVDRDVTPHVPYGVDLYRLTSVPA